MDDHELAAQQPYDIDDAVECMRTTLEHFHRNRDKRAIFLRLYYIMTLEVQAAIKGWGVYTGRKTFMDPDWVARLSGRFSSKYFSSLIACEQPADRDWAWKEAYRVAGEKGSAVIENALLGINAHINHDLPIAVAENLAEGDLDSYAVMQRRKFDHDQVNNLLIRVLDPIQDVLRHDYDQSIGLADRLMGNLDEKLSEVALKYYRERVWWDALAYAAARTIGREDTVRDKLNWESYKTALVLIGPKLLWLAERVLSRFGTRKRWDLIPLEKEGGVETKERSPINLVQPNPRRRLKRSAPVAPAGSSPT
jgi:hypothetical protein